MRTLALPYATAPVRLCADQAVVYGEDYTHPLRHFRLSAGGLDLLRRVLRGRPVAPDGEGPAFLRRLPFVAIYEATLPRVESVVVDGQLGGPSEWAGVVHSSECARGVSSLLVSFRQRRIACGGVELPLPAPWNRRTCLAVARALVQALSPERVMVVGHEPGARLFDLLSPERAWLVETGFAESEVVPARAEALFDRVLDEVLFREHAFPWDNLAQSLGTAEAIRRSRGWVWSAPLAARLAARFPEASVGFVPPSVDLCRFAERSASGTTGRLRILAGTGAHTLGAHGVDFLALRALVAAVRAVEEATLTVVTGDPERLLSLVDADHPRVAVRARASPAEMTALYAGHDVYYRVQADASLPLSCVEALASGLAVLMSDLAAETFPALRHGENALFVQHGSSAELERAFRLLAGDGVAARIGQAAAATARRACGLSDCLRAIGWWR